MDRKTNRAPEGWKEAEFDAATAREVMSMPWAQMFSARLYVSHLCPPGCLRVEEEGKGE
jgi:hypothetical protein